ncbi:hypothetical protein GCM10028804_13580 [Larkinella terrae]
MKPKDIYSPIVLNDSVKVISTSTKDRSSCAITFPVLDPALSYGVMLFYDSLESITYIKQQIAINPLLSYTAQKVGEQTFTSTNIKFDLNKGQFIYLVPYGYRTENGAKRIITAKGHIKVQISPWVFQSVLPGSLIRNKVRIYENHGLINCLKIEDAFINNYQFDPVSRQWTKVGTIKNETCYGLDYRDPANPNKPIVSFPLYATEVYKVYVVNERYHVLVNLKADVPDVNRYKYSLSLLTLDKNFSLIDCQSIAVLRDRNVEVMTTFTDDKNLYVVSRADSNLINCSRIPFAKPTVTKLTLQDKIDPSKFYLWTNNTLITGGPEYSNTFKAYKITSNTVSRINPDMTSGDLYYQTDQQTIPFQLSSSSWTDIFLNKGQGFLALNVEKVESAKIKTNMSTVYTAWFPRGNSRYISHGYSGTKELVLVVSDYEIWTFDIYGWSENEGYKLSSQVIKL